MKSKSTTKPIYSKEIGAASSALSSAYNQNSAGTQDIANSITSRLPALADKAFGENPLLKSAQGFAQDTIGGKYLTNNPYVEDMVSRARDGASDQISGAFGTSGRLGSGNFAERFAEGVGGAELGVRSGIYEQERQRQMQAASMAPGLNAADYDGIGQYLQAAGVGAELPYLASQKYAQGIGGLLGQYTKTKSTAALGPALIGAAGSIASAYAGR